MEELATQHISAFSKFLGKKKISSKTNARQKLGKLSKNQFAELSTDVYDELQRRTTAAIDETYLAPRDSFHPKRNQARQKLATLPLNRFEELVSDVYGEVTTRFPYIDPDTQESLKVVIPSKKNDAALAAETVPLPPPPKQSSRSKPPSKEPPPLVNFKSLDNLMADLGGMMSPSAFSDNQSPVQSAEPQSSFNAPVSAISSGPQNDFGSASVYQSQIDGQVRDQDQEIQRLNSLAKKLQSQIRDRDGEIQRLDSQLEKSKALASENESLSKNISNLTQEREELEQKMSDLQRDSNALLSELKTLSVENASLRGAKEKSASQINELFIQIQDWKTRFEDEAKKRKAAETELGNVKRDRDDIKKKASVKVRPSSIIEKLNYGSRTNPNIDFEMDGIVGNQVLEKSLLEDYYIAVTELLSEARAQEEPNTNILVAMKNIVYACKTITQDLDAFEQTLESSPASPIQNLSLLKQDMSQALTYQMGLAKQFAVEPDEIVKEAIEEATTALTGVIVDIYRATDTILASRPLTQAERFESTQTLALDDPVEEQAVDTGSRESLTNLKKETDEIVKSIQSLLTILKSPSLNTPDLDTCISNISAIVSALIETCEGPVRKLKGDECDDIFYSLEDGQDGLIQLGERLKVEPGNKSLKQQIAATAYDIAKVVKRLIEVI